MPERSELANMIFGRLTWEAIPYHEPILLATFAVVALVGVALGLRVVSRGRTAATTAIAVGAVK